MLNHAGKATQRLGTYERYLLKSASPHSIHPGRSQPISDVAMVRSGESEDQRSSGSGDERVLVLHRGLMKGRME